MSVQGRYSTAITSLPCATTVYTAFSNSVFVSGPPEGN
jgi:hypothetical protein